MNFYNDIDAKACAWTQGLIDEGLIPPGHVATPNYLLFDSAWRRTCSVIQCSVADVDIFVQAHYLHKRPAIVLLCLMMLHGNRPVGCVIYSAPPLAAEFIAAVMQIIDEAQAT